MIHIKGNAELEGHHLTLIAEFGRMHEWKYPRKEKGLHGSGSEFSPLKCLWLKGKLYIGENWQAAS